MKYLNFTYFILIHSIDCHSKEKFTSGKLSTTSLTKWNKNNTTPLQILHYTVVALVIAHGTLNMKFW